MEEALRSIVIHVELLRAMEHLKAANALKLRIMKAKILEKQMKRRFATAIKKARSLRNKLSLSSMRFDKRIRRGLSTSVRSINHPKWTGRGRGSLLVRSQREVYLRAGCTSLIPQMPTDTRMSPPTPSPPSGESRQPGEPQLFAQRPFGRSQRQV